MYMNIYIYIYFIHTNIYIYISIYVYGDGGDAGGLQAHGRAANGRATGGRGLLPRRLDIASVHESACQAVRGQRIGNRQRQSNNNPIAINDLPP